MVDPAEAIAALVKEAAAQQTAVDGWKYACTLIASMNRAIVDLGDTRRMYGRLLQKEGWSDDEIGEWGGMTRQRVDQILKQ